MKKISQNEFNKLLDTVEGVDTHIISEGDGWIKPYSVKILLTFDILKSDIYQSVLISNKKCQKSDNYRNCLILQELKGGYVSEQNKKIEDFRRRVNKTVEKFNEWIEDYKKKQENNEK
jgi:hypothetical protein